MPSPSWPRPGHFSRTGLAQMLVGARSWQGRDYPEYGRLSTYGRKAVAFQIEILLQQQFLARDGDGRLIPALGPSGGE